MNIYSVDVVKCPECGLDAVWEQSVNCDKIPLSDEHITCDHCGYHDLLNYGHRLYDSFVKQCEGMARGEGWQKPNCPNYVPDDGLDSSGDAGAESSEDSDDLHIGNHSPATSAADSNPDDESESSREPNRSKYVN